MTDAPTIARPLAAFLCRCRVKGCKATARFVMTETKTETIRTRYGAYEVEVPAVIIEHRAMTLDDLSRYGWLPYCVAHRRQMAPRRVNGTHNADVACNARCMGAIGPDCECSCSGENHGGKWGR